jgi:putative endonuclease
MKYYVYIIQSQRFDKYYIGSTSDIEKRIEFHNSRRARYTKRYQPWVLRHIEEYNSRAEAVRRERELKGVKDVRRVLEQLGKIKE